jgi:hypothetical protein
LIATLFGQMFCERVFFFFSFLPIIDIFFSFCPPLIATLFGRMFCERVFFLFF